MGKKHECVKSSTLMQHAVNNSSIRSRLKRMIEEEEESYSSDFKQIFHEMVQNVFFTALIEFSAICFTLI